MSNNLPVVPSGLQLPAHLQTPDVIAQIAAANAAAAGGVRAGGFPTISLKANKFNIKDGGEVTPLMNPPAAAGQPALPMMCLEVVVVSANPALSHTFFEGDYVEGESIEPACRSSNGVTPDSDVPKMQNAVCASCPQYAWGSKISRLTNKEIRACSDSKQLAILPAGDLAFKMLGLQVGPGSLSNWGKYISALTGRGYGVSTLVTNIVFDQTKTGVLEFSFNRFLTAEEYAKVGERASGEDVRVIVAQSRALAPTVTLSAPAAAPALAAPAPASAPAAVISGFGAAPAPAAPAPEPAALPAAITDPFAGHPEHVKIAVMAVGGLETHAGLNTYKAMTGIDYMAAVATAMTPPATAKPEPAKRTRRTREQIAADEAAAAGAQATPVFNGPLGGAVNTAAAPDLSHIPPEVQATIKMVGAGSPAGMALIAAYPAPAAAPAPAASPAAPPPAPTPTAAAPAPGFGAVPAQAVPAAAVVAAGASLAEKLRAKLASMAAPA